MADTNKGTDRMLRNLLSVLFIIGLFNLTQGIPYIGYVLFFVSVFIGLYYFFQLLSKKEIITFGWLMLLFVVLWFAAWLISDKQVYQSSSGTIRNTTELLTPVISFCLTYYPFYCFGKRGLITTKFITSFIYVMFGIAIVVFLGAFHSTSATYDPKYGDSINSGYVFAVAMPLLGLLWGKRNKAFYILMIIAFFFSIISAKRGAMLCATASFLLMALSLMGNKSITRNRFNSIFFFLVLVGVAFLIFNKLLESNANLATKIEATEEGSFSGRDVFYLELLDYYLDTSVTQKLFGIKFMGAVGVVGFDAHNDWLEILIDAGLTEAVVYLLMMITLCTYAYRNRHWLAYNEKYALWACAVVWLIKSLVSMGFTVPETRLYIITFAMISGMVETRKIHFKSIRQN